MHPMLVLLKVLKPHYSKRLMRFGPSETRGAWSSAIFLSRTICNICGACFPNKPSTMVGFNWRANLVACYMLFPSILWPIDKLQEFHEDIVSCSELDVTDFLFFK